MIDLQNHKRNVWILSIDAVIADFISGAVEWLCPENDDDHWDLVEGQGSLFNVSYAGVTIGLAWI